jgi:hypothetical protein
MANDTGLTLVDGNMLLPAAEDMLPMPATRRRKNRGR